MTDLSSEQTAAAVERGRGRLIALQDGSGSWASGRAANVWLTAADLLFREFAGIRADEVTLATARWLRSRQRPDGSWGDRVGDRPAAAASVLTYCALRLAGDSADAYHMALAAGWIRDAGGLAAADFATRAWLAVFGQVAWGELAVLPPEAIFLPVPYQSAAPGHAGLEKAAMVALSVLAALRPARRLPFNLAELRLPRSDAAGRDQPPRLTGISGLDRGLSAYERHAAQFAPFGAARSGALRRCAEWIAEAQRPDGSWPGDASRHFCLMALRLAGYPAEHPVVARGLAGLEAETAGRSSPAGQQRWLETGGPAVATTAHAMCALADAGLPADHHVLTAAGDWILASAVAAVAGSVPRRQMAELRAAVRLQLRGQPVAARSGTRAQRAAGAGRRPSSNGPVPGTAARRRVAGSPSPAAAADVAAAVVALRRVTLPASSAQRQAIVCLVEWLTDTQRSDGGWGRHNDGPAARQPGRAPSGPSRVNWRPASSPELTARALAALATAGQPGSPVIRRAGTWLLRQQLPDGSWPAECGTGDLQPTCAALDALVAAGVVAAKAPVTRATGWLLQCQNPDGGWGPGRLDQRSAGSGKSTVLHTAQAVLALLASGGHSPVPAIERGVCWLTGAQQADGGWSEPSPEGAGAQGDDGQASGAVPTAWALTALARQQSAGMIRLVASQNPRADVVRPGQG